MDRTARSEKEKVIIRSFQLFALNISRMTEKRKRIIGRELSHFQKGIEIFDTQMSRLSAAGEESKVRDLSILQAMNVTARNIYHMFGEENLVLESLGLAVSALGRVAAKSIVTGRDVASLKREMKSYSDAMSALRGTLARKRQQQVEDEKRQAEWNRLWSDRMGVTIA